MDYNDIPPPDHSHPPGCDCEPCFAYLRVSKVGGRGDKLISPELQLKSTGDWANANKKRIIAVIADVDKSGRKGGRNAVKRRVAELVERIQAGEAKGVVLWKWSRWGRNSLESRIHMHQVEEAGGSVYASTEDIRRDTAAGRLGVGVLMDIAEFESDRISSVWKETHERRRNDSLPHNSQARFGYIMDKGRFYVDESLRQVVADAYKAWVTGTSFRAIARDWNARGIRTTRGGKWREDGSTVRRVMDQGFAAGLIREHSDPSNRNQAFESYDVWRVGIHEPIIDIELWNDYRTQRLANNKMPARQVASPRELIGILMCGAPGCDGKMVAASNGRGDQGWKCSRVRDLAAHPSNTISLKRTDELTLKWIEENIPTGDVDALVAEIMATKPSIDTAAIDAQIKACRATLDKIGRLVVSDVISEDQAKTQRAEQEAEIARLQALLDAAPKEREVRAAVRAFTTLRDEWDSYLPAGRREALSAVLKAVYVIPKWAEGYDPKRPLRFVPR